MDKTQGNGWIRSALIGAIMALCGIIATLLYQRLSAGETKVETLVQDTGAVERRVSNSEEALRVIDARVTVLEGGKRVQFDIKLDRALLQEQVQQEVRKQMRGGESP